MARGDSWRAAHWSETSIVRVLRPIQDFMHNSAAGGLVLMAATVLALILANSPLAELYDEVLHSYIAISAGPFELRENVLHWVNDGLMAIFFLLIGLEIKREVMVGELSNPRAAILPIAAAIGGVTIPALFYILVAGDGPGASGWGIPMATDIAFALGVLALLGSRIPFGLKVFLTAVAIVDDLIAVLVIAVFYSGGINFVALGIGIAILLFLLLANLWGVRSILFYLALGLVVWVAFLESGVHATIAGVLLAFTIPARVRINLSTFIERVQAFLTRVEPQPEMEGLRMVTDERQQSAIIAIEETCEDAQAPLQKLEHELHVPVSFVIVPIFALANAGVPLALSDVAGEAMPLALGIILGLVLGKPIGILIAAWLVTQLDFASLPIGVTWHHMIGASFLAGIGFTMSLFIASLAFGEGSAFLDTAKLAILAASVVAGGIGALILVRTPSRPRVAEPALDGVPEVLG